MKSVIFFSLKEVELMNFAIYSSKFAFNAQLAKDIVGDKIDKIYPTCQVTLWKHMCMLKR